MYIRKVKELASQPRGRISNSVHACICFRIEYNFSFHVFLMCTICNCQCWDIINREVYALLKLSNILKR